MFQGLCHHLAILACLDSISCTRIYEFLFIRFLIMYERVWRWCRRCDVARNPARDERQLCVITSGIGQNIITRDVLFDGRQRVRNFRKIFLTHSTRVGRRRCYYGESERETNHGQAVTILFTEKQEAPIERGLTGRGLLIDQLHNQSCRARKGIFIRKQR